MTSQLPRGLATVALLKARFDEGRDHLGLFEPFVEDALRNAPADNFIAGDICALVTDRSGLVVPANSMQALLSRFARAGYLERSGGRFLRTAKPFTHDRFEDAVAALQQEQLALAEALAVFAATQHVTLNTEDALAALVTFVGENKVSLVLDGLPGDAPQRTTLTHKQSRVLARFVTQRCLAEPTLKAALSALVEGLVLRDTLLLSDLADLGARFQHVTVAVDTPILLAALDLTGVANGIVAREFLSLLQQTGARTIVFDPTRSEVRGVLALYEHKLATAVGRLSLYRNEMTIHALNAKLTPSDMRAVASLLDRKFAELGLQVISTPKHDAQFTLDEVALANALVLPREPDPDRPRIRHDVDCVAAVLTLRRGKQTPRLEHCVAVLCSSTTQVVRNVTAWYKGQGGTGVPPVVHQVAVSSIAWLKRPNVARGIKMHELAATCAAVLRPKRATWDKFTETLKRLRADGSLSDDEAVALVASDLAEPVLAELDEDFDPDSDTILDAVERVKRAYKAESDAVAASLIADARADTALARDAAADAARDATAVRTAVEGRIRKLSGFVARWCERGFVIVLIAAAALSVPGAFELVPTSVGWIARAVVGITAVFSVVSARRGDTVDGYREAIDNFLATKLRRSLIGAADRDASIGEPESGADSGTSTG